MRKATGKLDIGAIKANRIHSYSSQPIFKTEVVSYYTS